MAGGRVLARRPDGRIVLVRGALPGETVSITGPQRRGGAELADVDDVVEGVVRAARHPARADDEWSSGDPDLATSQAPFRIYNIGNSKPVNLMDMIGALEDALGIEAIKHFEPMAPGDVPATWADTTDLERDVGYRPSTPLSARAWGWLTFRIEAP